MTENTAGTTTTLQDHAAIAQSMVSRIEAFCGLPRTLARFDEDARCRAVAEALLASQRARTEPFWAGLAAAATAIGLVLTRRWSAYRRSLAREGTRVVVPVELNFEGERRSYERGPEGRRLAATVGDYGDKTRYPEPKAGWNYAKIAAAAKARLDAHDANLVQHAARKSCAVLSAEVAARVAVTCGLSSYQDDVRAVESHADRVEVRLGSPVVDEAMAVRLLTAVGLITGRLKGGVVLTLSADEARVVRQCLEFGMDALPADDRTLASAAFDQLVKAGA